MKIRELAKEWLKKKYPGETENQMNASKYHPDQNIWFFTFPAKYFGKNSNNFLNIILQKQFKTTEFILLKVPFSFFKQNKSKFDIRQNGEQFDLHISGKRENWLVDERSGGICFAPFEQ